MLVALLVVGLTVLLTIKIVDQLSGKKNSVLRDELAVHRSVVNNQQLREAIDVIGEGNRELAEQAAQLEKIVSSDDPIAHNILVTSAKEAKTQQLRALSEKAIIDRARRLGLMRSSEQVRQWLRGLRADELPSIYEAVLQSLDTTLPIEARNSLLRQAYASNARLVLKLAAALTLDSSKFEDYQPVLGQLIADSMKLEDASVHSALSLILANPELAMMFGDDVVQRREQIPDRDIIWLLRILAERNDVNVRAIANVALERNIVPPLQAVFLGLIRDRSDLTPDLMTALIRSAAGVPRVEDIAAFGRWYDVDSERVLLALCAQGGDPSLLTETFDTLAGKSLTIEPSASLVGWIRRNYWEKRADFARIVGMLAFLNIASVDEIRTTLDGMERFAKDPAWIDILLDVKNPVVSKLIVEKYSDLLGLGGLLNLLGNSDREVRITAIRQLKGYNDVGALKFILDHYERERDPVVREAYKENFWVIKQREGGAAAPGSNAR